MDTRAATSKDRTTSLRLSLFGMTFSFVVSRLKPLRLKGRGERGAIRPACEGAVTALPAHVGTRRLPAK